MSSQARFHPNRGNAETTDHSTVKQPAECPMNAIAGRMTALGELNPREGLNSRLGTFIEHAADLSLSLGI